MTLIKWTFKISQPFIIKYAGKFLTFNTQFIIVGDIYPESCKVYHRGYNCVSYNQHPSR